MKRKLQILFLLLFFAFPIVSNAIVTNSSYSNIRVYYFYGEKCKECDTGKEWLEETLIDHNRIRIEYIDIEEYSELWNQVKDTLTIKKDELPLIVIGSNYFVGYNEKIEENVMDAIAAYEEADDSCDVVAKLRNHESTSDCIADNQDIYEQPKEKSNIWIWILPIGIVCVVVLGIVFFLKKKKVKNG